MIIINKTTITAFFKKNLWNIIKIGGIIILVILLMQQCNRSAMLKKELKVANQNIIALNDTIKIVKTKNGNPEVDKYAFLVSEINDLKKLSADLYAEVKNTKGKVSTIIKGDVQIVHDTVPLVVHSQMVDSTVTSAFNFDTTYSAGNYRKLQGFTQYNLRNGNSFGRLTVDKTGFRFVTGIKDLDKGKPTIFVRSDSPDFVVDNLSGAELDPNLFKPRNKQHLLTLGLNVGWTPFTYDFIKKKAAVNIGQIGASVGLNVNLLRLFNK